MASINSVNGITQNFNKITPSYMGAMCAQFRRYHTNYSQADVAKELGIERSSVGKFERGRNNRAYIFMWYIKHGIFRWCPAERWNGWDMGM